jgi:hypothetical protein
MPSPRSPPAARLHACPRFPPCPRWLCGECRLRAGSGGLAEGVFDVCEELGVVGLGGGGVSSDNLAVPADEELGEVPGDVAGEAGVGLRVGEEAVEGVDVGPFDGDLGEEGEGDVVGGGAEELDLVVGGGLLGAEIVCWEGEDGQAAGAVAVVEGLEAGVLAGVAALAGDVDQEQDAAAEGREGQRAAVDVGQLEGVEWGGGGRGGLRGPGGRGRAGRDLAHGGGGPCGRLLRRGPHRLAAAATREEQQPEGREGG